MLRVRTQRRIESWTCEQYNNGERGRDLFPIEHVYNPETQVSHHINLSVECIRS